MQSFVNKGRLSPVVESMPVHVVTNENAGLLGAARCAAVRTSMS
jgi:glucokinase